MFLYKFRYFYTTPTILLSVKKSILFVVLLLMQSAPCQIQATSDINSSVQKIRETNKDSVQSQEYFNLS